MIHSILVVCIGNICRSPMAQGALARALPGLAVHSAGIDAMMGHSADPLAQQVMREHGIDISAHRAQSLTNRMIDEADLILTMDAKQKRFIEFRHATSKGKVFRLGEYGSYDIPDPYLQDLAAFQRVRDLIARGVGALSLRIVHTNKPHSYSQSK